MLENHKLGILPKEESIAKIGDERKVYLRTLVAMCLADRCKQKFKKLGVEYIRAIDRGLRQEEEIFKINGIELSNEELRGIRKFIKSLFNITERNGRLYLE